MFDLTLNKFRLYAEKELLASKMQGKDDVVDNEDFDGKPNRIYKFSF